MNPARRICVTGAAGFIGHALCSELLAREHVVRGVVRSQGWLPEGAADGIELVAVGEIGEATDWSAALACVDCVIHCAARAHIMREAAVDALAAYRAVNVEGTRRLAEQAAALGVRRLVFLSSIGVLGINTNGRGPFSLADAPTPLEDYAISKWEAEQVLHEVAARTGLEVVIIRPPLVYGPDAPGNFGALMHAVQHGWLLPLGSVHNLRSLVALDNLMDFIVLCMSHFEAANQTFLVSDGHDLSTTELVRSMARAAGIPVRLLPVPVWVLQAGAALLRKDAAVQRLCGNLQVDISKARELLDWVPPISVDEGLRRAVQGSNLTRGRGQA